MKRQLAVLAAVFAVAHAAPALAQSATGMARPPTAATPSTDHAGAYNALSEDNRKIVSAIYEAQLGSPKDDGTGTILSRDEIATMRAKAGWADVYRQLHQKGMVTEKNLGQAVNAYSRSLRTGGNTDVMVIYTAGGEQIAVKREKPGAAAPAPEAATAKATIVGLSPPTARPKAPPAAGDAVRTSGAGW